MRPALPNAPGRMVFWYEFASTYSYLAAFSIEAAARAAGIAVEWKPFLLGPIFARQGWQDSPFNLFPAKGRYMWRDLERLCARATLPWRRPTQFPRNGLLAARIALVGAEQGWAVPFAKAVFRANFAEDRDIAGRETLHAILEDLKLSPASILARAQSVEIKERLRAETEEAAALGIFGAPSFQVGKEIFWGHDRLADALDWATRARLGAESG